MTSYKLFRSYNLYGNVTKISRVQMKSCFTFLGFGDMDGLRKIFPTFLSHYATFFAKMAERKVVPLDEFYYQLKLMHLFLLHSV
jgi:hypothetical protein